jgi:hypothetical protein
MICLPHWKSLWDDIKGFKDTFQFLNRNIEFLLSKKTFHLLQQHSVLKIQVYEIFLQMILLRNVMVILRALKVYKS